MVLRDEDDWPVIVEGYAKKKRSEQANQVIEQ